MKPSPVFRLSGRDTLSQFAVFFFVFGGGCLPFPFMIYHGFGVLAVVIFFVAAMGVAVGLRFSIVASAKRVRITRSWLGIPYWRHTGRVINDVFYDGNWGDAEVSSGVVLDLDGREVHVGSGSSMHELHAGLQPFVTQGGESSAS